MLFLKFLPSCGAIEDIAQNVWLNFCTLFSNAEIVQFRPLTSLKQRNCTFLRFTFWGMYNLLHYQIDYLSIAFVSIRIDYPMTGTFKNTTFPDSSLHWLMRTQKEKSEKEGEVGLLDFQTGLSRFLRLLVVCVHCCRNRHPTLSRLIHPYCPPTAPPKTKTDRMEKGLSVDDDVVSLDKRKLTICAIVTCASAAVTTILAGRPAQNRKRNYQQTLHRVAFHSPICSVHTTTWKQLISCECSSDSFTWLNTWS